VHRTSRPTDLHRWPRIWLHRLDCLARNHTVKIIQNHHIIVHELPLADKFIWETNKSISSIRHMDMVICLQSSHFQAFCCLITILHSTWHTGRNQPPVHAKNIQVMGHSGKNMTSTKVGMVGLKWSPLGGFHDKGCHLQVCQESFQDCQKTIQSIGQHLQALILHLDILPAHLEYPQLGSKWTSSSRLQNHSIQMSEALRPCPHCWRFSATNMMQMLRAMIHRTWVVQKAHC